VSETPSHVDLLFAAELQVRLAAAVRLATNAQTQPLAVPLQWSHGEHQVRYEEIAIRQDQAEVAAAIIQLSASYLLAVAAKDAIRSAVPDPKSAADADVRSAYQIARLIRNAFAHSPFNPIWSIDADCRDREFEVAGTIRLNTTGLHGERFNWRHYGGPLALLALARFVRHRVLGEPVTERKDIPLPKDVYSQQGDLIFKRVESPPTDP
jgi:hypothetical protein